MANTKEFGIVTLRTDGEWRARIDIAARMSGVSRSEFIRRAAIEVANRDLARITPPVARTIR